MTVSQLITLLEGLDPEKEVMIAGYEGGYNDVGNIREERVLRDIHTEWYYGKHEPVDNAGYDNRGRENEAKDTYIIS